MKKNFLAALLLSAALALAGCNTVQGFGQDLKKGAEHVGAALGKAGDKIPVDYCERRFVKKPPKAAFYISLQMHSNQVSNALAHDGYFIPCAIHDGRSDILAITAIYNQIH